MSPKENRGLVLKGIGVSSGIAIGKAYIFEQMEMRASYYKLEDAAHVEGEIERLEKAINFSIDQLAGIKSKLAGFEVKEPVYILDMHIMMLRDASFMNRTVQNIREHCINVEWAVGMTVDAYKKIFSKLDDEYIRGRIGDVQAIGQRVIRNLLGETAARRSLPSDASSVIIVARNLSPADTAQLKIDKVQGFVTDVGSRTSHTTMVARSLEMPAVVGMENVTQVLRTNDDIIVDGAAGLVIVNPDAELTRRYEAKRRDHIAARKAMLADVGLPAITKDGYRVKISCNIEFAEEIPSAIEHGAEGIGLYRTEFLYINRQSLASEEEHWENYRGIVAARPLAWATIRTFDLGGDKFFSDKSVKETNPQMGLRAIRFCLKEEEIFKKQLRAIMRSASEGKTKILLPMISGLEEVLQVKKILTEIKNEMATNGFPVANDVEIGAMIEVPSAAMIAEELAKEVDFFSIGTNDLIQYAFAIDRINEHVAYLYEPLHPAVLRLIKRVVDAGHKAGIEVAMCGEMVGDPMNTAILLAMRIDEMSMHQMAIPRVKSIIRKMSLADADLLLAKVMPLSSAREIRQCVEEYMRRNFAKELIVG